MNISVQKLLGKIEEEVMLAKQAATVTQIRERIHAVKTLCELVLDEPAAEIHKPVDIAAYSPPVQTQPVTLPQPGRIKPEDGANGESLFDF